MTRINVGIKPKELPSKLLIAELRELVRIPNQVKTGKYDMKGQPIEFKLGTGHVKFFYDKLGYLFKRYNSLRKEALNRGYNVQDFSNSWDEIPNNMMGEYTEQPKDREILISRIKKRGFDIKKIT
jgi:deoxyribonuclease (pyrimidine dimer)